MRSALQTVGGCIMAVVTGIGNVIHAIVSAVVSCVGIVVSFVTCGYCGRKRHRATPSHV